jgi:hypothetical protein
MKVIDVQNIKGNFFGGLPFDVNWSFGGGDSPSRLVVSVVNESGRYGNPQNSLGFGSTEEIKIGNFSFKGYLVSYQFKNSPDKKILELTYVDKGADLDRYFVGLNHRYGEKDNNNANNLILVGKSYHPCDQNLDSEVEFVEEEGQVDPCDPCPEMPPNKYENACDPVLEDFNIFEVYYTFNELISKLDSVGIPCSLDTNNYKEYKSTHVGSLRQVLGSWCSDLGLAFFWDAVNNQLVFLSRKNSLDIPNASDLENNENIIDLEYGGSIENTFSQGSIGYLGRQGEVITYNCKKSTLENLKCLNLGALAEDGTFNSGSGGSGGGQSQGDELKDLADYEMKELAVALSYYSTEMRDAVLWFNYYGNYSAKDIEAKLNVPSAGTGPSANKVPKNDNILSFFGNMEILDVYGADCQDQDRRQKFTRINQAAQFSKKDEEALNLELRGPGTVGTKENPNYYFFVARINEEAYEKEKSRERELAKNFMGKFWIKDFETTIPNATNSKTEVTVESPDGNGSWYYKNSQLKNLNIFDFGHDEGSYISLLDNEIPDTEDEYDQNLETYTQDPEEKEFRVKGFILYEREPKWFPDEDYSKWYTSLFEWYAAQTPKKFIQSEGRPPILLSLYPDAINDPSIRLYIVRKGAPESYKTSVEILKLTDHPKEYSKRPVKNETEQDIFGEINIREICSYGLGDQSEYVKITVGDNDIIIHTPIESFERVGADPENVENVENGENEKEKILYGEIPPQSSKTGYDVIVTANSDFQIYSPKFEYVTQYTAEDIAKVANVTYHYENIQENNLNFFRKNNGNKNSIRSNCKIDQNEVEKYMNRVNKFTHYKMSNVQNRASFRTAGVFPINYGIRNGLANLTIVVNDAGVFTDYVLEDRIISPPSLNILEQNLRNFVPIKKQKNEGSVSPINETNLRKYENAIRNV